MSGPEVGASGVLTRTRRRIGRVGLLVAAPLACALVLPATQSAANGTTSSAVKLTKKVSRVHLIDGKNVVADKRTVTLSVNQTADLHDRQEIVVKWSGAHPTGRGFSDPNDPAARLEEYPMVLLECRGVDSSHAPTKQRLDPKTCWTQTSLERYFQSPSLVFPPWRVDRYATTAERKKVVGAPHPMPSNCFTSGYAEKWLPFVAADGKSYPGGNFGCGGIAPEAGDIGATLSLPGNTTYAVTGADGSGEAKFDVWSALSNASLGCSPSVSCSLVAVPIEGISCDVAAAGQPSANQPQGDNATAAEDACTAVGGHTQPDISVTGELWWSASNWRNRITVPLRFAPLPTICGVGSSQTGIDIYGSELMTAATQQWGSLFCKSSKLFPLTHVQTGETQARTLLISGNTDAAFTSLAPTDGYPTPIVSAPVAMTGFVIGYSVDDSDGHEYTNLRLTPRLLAKLLTESYPSISAVKQGWAQEPTSSGYPAAANNPQDISRDPEFIALNPGIPQGVTAAFGASTLLNLSGNSDVISALTAYINADHEARAWLNGQPDPWGMVVNPHYRGIKLPVDSWPLLDTYEPHSIYDNGSNECLHENPVPYLPLVASPTAQLANISLDLQFAIDPAQVVCQLSPSGGTAGAKLVALGREPIGNRFLLGVTSLADARRYEIDTAALQTRIAADAPAKFTGPSGRDFVAPTDASLTAAARLLQPNSRAGIWRLPLANLVGRTGSTTAYPGAMLVSAAVPTVGLPQAEASDYATFLRFAAGAGQVTGGGDGQLPDGYLPLTSRNGLGAQAHYTEVAASYVAARNGKVPSLLHPAPLPKPATPTPAPSTSPSPTPASSGSGFTPGGGGPTSGGLTGPTSPPVPSSQPTSSAPVPSLAPTPGVTVIGVTAASAAGVTGAMLPVLLLIGVVAGVGVPAINRMSGRRS